VCNTNFVETESESSSEHNNLNNRDHNNLNDEEANQHNLAKKENSIILVKSAISY
jgi:hypothetical protein